MRLFPVVSRLCAVLLLPSLFLISCSLKSAEEKLADELSKRLEQKLNQVDLKKIQGAVSNLSEKDRQKLKDEGKKILDRL